MSAENEDAKREEARRADRAKELKECSTDYLVELARTHGIELCLINRELEERLHKGYQKVVGLPCQVQELETALTTYMNSHGLAEGLANVFPDDDGKLAVFVRPPKETK